MDALFADVIERLDELHAGYCEQLDGLSIEELDWSPGAEMNSLCVLAVHVTAAERFWIGIAIDARIERDRPAEFRACGHSLADLKARFAANTAFYRQVFGGQSVDRLGERVRFRFMDRSRECTRGWALLHGLAHTAEHLGHAGMTRQLLERR